MMQYPNETIDETHERKSVVEPTPQVDPEDEDDNGE